jgi:hypothetical protein
MTHKLSLTLATAAMAAALAVPTASAIVPPKDCGTTTVKNHRYQIKVDQITCKTGKKYAVTYLRSHTRPSRWKCTNYPSTSKFKFRCFRGVKNIYAIKR